MVKMEHRKNGLERIFTVVMVSERSEMGDDE